MGEEWFRRQAWSSEDKADFAKRLKRVRSDSGRAQYLRIQAWHLQEIGSPELLHAALELLEILLKEVPERMELASANEQRAQCLASLGRPDEALAAYREAFVAQRAFPNVRTNGYLAFGEFVLSFARTDLYDEVLEVLEEFGGDEFFPIQQYRFAVVLACIAENQGDRVAARKHAGNALAAAAKTESPFRYHRNLGLVGSLDPDIEARLKRLARPQGQRSMWHERA